MPIHPRRRSRNSLILSTALVFLAGCATPVPSATTTIPIESPTSTVAVTPITSPTPTASPTFVGLPTPIGSSTTVTSPTPGPSVVTVDLALTIHTIPEAWAKKTGPAVASDGTEIVWSEIASFDSQGQPFFPDLVSFVPGKDAEPRIIYRHPDRDSRIWTVAVRHGHYAFLEFNDRLLGDGWRLWALSGPDRTAVLLDQSGDPANAPAPSIALTDEGVIWNAVHMRGGVATYELRTAKFDGSDPRALLASPVADKEYWFPDTDPTATHVLFATVEPVGSGDLFRLYSLDLTDPGAKPIRLGDSDEATQPVTNGTTLAWRVIDDNVANWGKGLVVADAAGNGARAAPVSSELSLSIGRRFIAYDKLSSNDLVLYDTEADRLAVVERHAPPDLWTMQRGWTLVAGDLLVFRRGNYTDDANASKPPEVCWALLPAPST